MKATATVLLLGALLAPSAPLARRLSLAHPVITYDADLPLRAIRRMGPIHLEVDSDGVRARNDSARGWMLEGDSRLRVIWRRPPLTASLPPDALAGAITRLAADGELTSQRVPVLVDLSDIHQDSIGGYEVELYRLRFSDSVHVNVWTTQSLPTSNVFRRLIREAAAAVSEETAMLVDQIPGLPLHVQLISRRGGRVDLLRLSGVGASHSIETSRGLALPVPLARLLLRMIR